MEVLVRGVGRHGDGLVAAEGPRRLHKVVLHEETPSPAPPGCFQRGGIPLPALDAELGSGFWVVIQYCRDTLCQTFLPSAKP